jgi:multiple sugar transport system substrate-binding protein
MQTCFALDVLKFGVSISTKAQREAFYSLARQFERENPGTAIDFTALTSEVYKDEFATFLTDQSYDVLYWHAGQRLFEYVEQGNIADLDEIWQQANLDQVFDPSVIENVKVLQHYYGLPIYYYQIGFYYNKLLFERLSLQEPRTWSEYLALCAQLKVHNIFPVFIGSASNWPATAWFDYLNLRINGLAFQQRLASGSVSFSDDRVKKVLEIWAEPINRGYFIGDHTELDWREGLPFLFRGLVGMSMIGNYVIQDIPENLQTDIGFFPFPILDDQIALYEEAPLDVLLIPRNAKNKALAMRFLAFASRSDIQSKLNAMLGVISPNRLAQSSTYQLVQEAYKVLNQAEGLTQFFDRDAKKTLADHIMPVFDRFLINPNVEKTLIELESARLHSIELLSY